MSGVELSRRLGRAVSDAPATLEERGRIIDTPPADRFEDLPVDIRRLVTRLEMRADARRLGSA